MPHIAIVRGFGEGYVATGYVIKLIKALNRRFRSKITYDEIPIGNYVEFGSELTCENLEAMGVCDAVFAGDMRGRANPLAYCVEDIAMYFSKNIKYTCISGVGNCSNIDVDIVAYFDGGARLRESAKTADGCSETRICSAYSATNIAKYVSRACENRRRRLAFVKDGDNEYCADLFAAKFEDCTMPLTNFRFVKFDTTDIVCEMEYNPTQFDTIFASESFADFIKGVCFSKMKDNFAAYDKFAPGKCIYSVKSMYGNAIGGNSVLSINSYVAALADMLMREFDMKKEGIQLRKALEYTVLNNVSPMNGDEFTASIIEYLQRPLDTHFRKEAPKRLYLR